MEKHSEGFVGIDVAKHRHAIAVAPDGRDQEVRFLGEVEATPEAMRNVVKRLAAKFELTVIIGSHSSSRVIDCPIRL